LQVLEVAGAGEFHVSEPLAYRRSAALGLGAKEVLPSVDEFVAGIGSGGRPLVIEATTAPAEFQDAVRAARIGGRVVLAGIPDGDGYTFTLRRGLKVKFVRRIGDDYRRAIDLVRSGRVKLRTPVTQRESLAAGA
jgi:L-iditol 2-dehydrogenase